MLNDLKNHGYRSLCYTDEINAMTFISKHHEIFSYA